MLEINKAEEDLILSVLQNVSGYPNINWKDERFGFERKETGKLFDTLIHSGKFDFGGHDKKIVLASFVIFLESLEDHEIVALTDEVRLGVERLYKKLRKGWGK